MKVLVTGAAGYVGSFTVLRLLEEGHDVVAIDNLSNSSKGSMIRVQELTGKGLAFYKADVTDYWELSSIFMQEDPDAVIHFAGLKNTRESIRKAGAYYSTNVNGTINVLRAMTTCDCNKIIFSSSCTVYNPKKGIECYTEYNPLGPVTPYGRSKLMCEQIIEDVCNIDPNAIGISLRYFNPIGAHPTGMMGEDSKNVTNLVPVIMEVAQKKRECLEIFGDDHDTSDGTCVRDYIHVLDVADAHIKALEHNESGEFNIGLEKGTSVKKMVEIFEEATGKKIPTKVVDAKTGDVAKAICTNHYAEETLGWEPKRDIKQAIEDSWIWAQLNPDGYSN